MSALNTYQKHVYRNVAILDKSYTCQNYCLFSVTHTHKTNLLSFIQLRLCVCENVFGLERHGEGFYSYVNQSTKYGVRMYLNALDDFSLLTLVSMI